MKKDPHSKGLCPKHNYLAFLNPYLAPLNLYKINVYKLTAELPFY